MEDNICHDELMTAVNDTVLSPYTNRAAHDVHERLTKSAKSRPEDQ